MRVYLVQVLDKFPAVPAYSRNTFKQAATTEDVTVAAGECTQVVRNFEFDAESLAQIEDVRVIAWAQQPLDGIPAEVHQATQLEWPFADLAVFGDGFESGDTDQWSSTGP
jgi:hypothetical protein